MIMIYSSIISIFFSMQLESSFARFYFNAKENNEHFDHLKTIAYLMGVFALVYSVPSYFAFNFLFANYFIDSFSYIFPIICFTAFLLNVTSLVNLHFRYNYERRNFVISSLLFPITYLVIIGVYLLVHESINFFIVFVAQGIGQLIVLLFQIMLVGKKLLVASFQSKNLKSIFKFSIPMLPMFFLIFANDKAVIYILREFIPLELLADFSLATKFLAFLSLFFFALRIALEPKVNRFVSFPNDDRRSEYRMYVNIYIGFSLVLLVIFMLVVPLVQQYFFPKFTNAYRWSIILAISLILLYMGAYMTPGFSIRKRMDIKLLIVLAQVTFNFVGFYFVLKNGYDVFFALKYLVLVNYIFLLIQHYFSNKLYKVSNEYLKATALFSLVFIV